MFKDGHYYHADGTLRLNIKKHFCETFNKQLPEQFSGIQSGISDPYIREAFHHLFFSQFYEDHTAEEICRKALLRIRDKQREYARTKSNQQR